MHSYLFCIKDLELKTKPNVTISAHALEVVLESLPQPLSVLGTGGGGMVVTLGLIY